MNEIQDVPKSHAMSPAAKISSNNTATASNCDMNVNDKTLVVIREVRNLTEAQKLPSQKLDPSQINFSHEARQIPFFQGRNNQIKRPEAI